MRPTVRLAALLAVALFPAAALAKATAAQTPAAAAPAADEIRGRVVDAATSQPIATASVAVWISGDPKPLAGVITGADGVFRIQGLRPGSYRSRISALGYVAKSIPSIALTEQVPSVDLGAVKLAPAATQVQGLQVTGQKREAQLAPDRNTYVVHDMPSTQGGTALDVLRNVPSVDVDIDNVVSLRGNSGVVVEINGRPSPMKPSQIGNFLAQLPADMVDKVEVIPNPSARYDPEGVAGIINIVLKKKTDMGSSGGLNMGAGTSGRLETGGNAGYQQGPWNLYGSYTFMRDNSRRSESINRDNLYLDPTTYLQEESNRTDTPLSHTLTGSAGYQLSPHDELSTDLLFSTRSASRDYTVFYRALDPQRVLAGLSDQRNVGSHGETSFESALAYKHTFPEDQHTLSTELRFDHSREGGPLALTRDTMLLDGTPLGETSRTTQDGSERPTEGSLKLDYSRPLGGALRLETGYKGSVRRFHVTRIANLFDYGQDLFIPDVAQSGDFTYDEQVHAGYALLDDEIGHFQLQAGGRLETANTRFHLNTTAASYDNRYTSLYPSALVAYNLDESRQFKLSYSKRVRRPDDTDLIDPTIHYVDPLNVEQGNPSLKPEYIHAVEIGFQQSTSAATLQLTPFYRHTVNAVRRIQTIDGAGVATSTFANVATSDDYGSDFTASLHSGRLSGFAGASAFQRVSNGANLGPGLSARTFGWTARANATVSVSQRLDVQTLFFYRGPMRVEQGRISSRSRLNLAAREKLMGDRVNLTLRILDPFNSDRERSTTIDPRFSQISERSRHARGLMLSASYYFGKPPKDQAPDEGDLGAGTGS